MSNLVTIRVRRTDKPSTQVTGTTNYAEDTKKTASETVIISGHFSPEVRRMLKTLKYKQDRQLKEIMGEAFNDIAVKYGEKPPFTEAPPFTSLCRDFDVEPFG